MGEGETLPEPFCLAPDTAAGTEEPGACSQRSLLSGFRPSSAGRGQHGSQPRAAWGCAISATPPLGTASCSVVRGHAVLGCALLKPPDLQYGKRPPRRSAHCPQQGNGERRQPPRSSPLSVRVSGSECCRAQRPRRKHACFLSGGSPKRSARLRRLQSQRQGRASHRPQQT
ncbi:unnamed protein product [Rangifer tarandus platyrhynchus]|uniref:Uncharacterized protein n=1 Tax=Rangifer tarandus platyrhynchus TaxID=3082113 RepID=A0ABN8ZTG1_RANTA|nr:unnamed protein product [Rangifer tarandus platyrhynchus]